MSDWSEHFLQAQKAMKKAENSLALRRFSEGSDWIYAAREELAKLSILLSEQKP